MSNLFEVNPTYTRKCTIRGVFPALVIGRQKAKNEDSSNGTISDLNISFSKYEDKTVNFCPEARFYVGTEQSHSYWPFAAKSVMHTGGWACGAMSLYQLYFENIWHKNRWSVSNCGFDTAKYRGTTFMLQQHAYIDYVFYWDSEYKDINHFLDHTDLHPLILLTHPQAILVKSKARAGPRRTKKVYISRPAWWPSGWSSMSDIAKTGLFCWFIMAVDLDNPWLGKFQNPFRAEGMWWKDQTWLTDWNNYVRDENKNTSNTERKRMYGDAGYANVRAGPFMLRSWKVEHDDYIYPQITIWYKSYWTWGGRSLTIKQICDPTKPLGLE